MFTTEEKIDMLESYISNNKNRTLALRDYITKFPLRRHPEKKIFDRIYQQFRINGTLKKEKNRRRHVLTNEEQLNILLHFEENPETSTRNASLDLDVRRTTLQTCLKINNRKEYKYCAVQKLEQRDYNTRLDFCNILMDRHFLENVFDNIIWTDESIFTTSNHIFNRKNTHYWSSENKKKVMEVTRSGRTSVKVWCAIWRDRIIGPVFFYQNLNSQRYLELLNNNIQPLVENEVPARERANLIWQQDGAPYHRSQEITNYLNAQYREWIGENGNYAWPPRSPDLTPLDFSLWGTVKDLVYKHKPSTAQELERRIREAIQYLNETEYVRKVVMHLETLYTTCIAQNGGHIEQLLQ